MKKSQALAALAFAFAMGIVAPVASTVSAFEVNSQNDATGTATGTATCAELGNAVTNIVRHANYQVFKNIDAVNAKYAAGDYRDIVTYDFNVLLGSVNGTPTLAGGVAPAGAVAQLQAALDANKTKVAAVTSSSIADTKTVLDAATSEDIYYTVFANLITAIEDSKHTGLNEAIIAFRAAAPGADALNYNPNTIIKDYVTDPTAAGSNVIDLFYGAGTYNYYKGLMNHTAVQEELAKAEAGKAAYSDILSQPGVLTGAALDNFNAKNVDTNNQVVMDLNYIATNNVNINRNWWTLYTTIRDNNLEDAAKTCTDSSAQSYTNFNTIWGLATTYKFATDQVSTNTKDIAEYLINYVPSEDPEDPSTPEDPSDPSTPSTPGSTEDSDKKEDKKPEATKTGSQGIVAKGAASASKTAGVMAAIATALTTAGAAVVAFRNARRNGNKEA